MFKTPSKYALKLSIKRNDIGVHFNFQKAKGKITK